MTNQESISLIEGYVRQVVSPNAEEWEAFRGILSPRRIRKKELILKQGQVCTFIAFVTEGFLREYNFLHDKDVTVDFISPSHFVTDYPSFLLQSPSVQYIEALTDVECLVFKRDDIHRLYDQYKTWERFGRLIAERIFCNAEARRKNIISKSAEDLYHDFVREYPHVVQHVPQYYIASYLGLSPEHLSRIRRKV
ncbi:Crp/Fnr family transcriptional regulator [Fulvivirgaceae bacterium PWU5]|uniref:Crp/Fnr family transcriptional regulator n=1 Tax=Dawidia cretensis TaxID=2782350 RepID=A0AAP2DWC8_9BACT|nr:Crp/Fnr family transcriptional regulator [Dawidia cretensis]MBT1707347.1 Crp/Fnr family transcriptional regulator [Dawidia cretensis]